MMQVRQERYYLMVAFILILNLSILELKLEIFSWHRELEFNLCFYTFHDNQCLSEVYVPSIRA